MTTAPARPVLRRCGGRQCPAGTCEHEGQLRRQTAGNGPALAPPSVDTVLRRPGQPLDATTRASLEPRFGHDFSTVRVHTDPPAAASARQVGARAWTVGSHVAFASGGYQPGTAEGQRLIAHELAHVVQQAGTPARPATALAVGATDAPEEVAADRMADAALAGRDAGPAAPVAPHVARQGDAGTPDAAPSTPDAGMSTPDAGPTAPGGTAAGGTAGGTATAGPPGPTGSPPAPPPRILRVEVENQREAISYPVPSNLGAAGRQHWVTVAGTRPDVVFRAVLDPPVAAGDPAVSGLTWAGIPAAALGAGADPLHAVAPVPTARKVVVRARLGASTAEATLWGVFVRVTTPGPAMAPPARTAHRVRLQADIHLTGTVFPTSVITDADHPALEGGVGGVDPPGGTNTCGDPLAGGADHRWDMSRQRRLRNIATPALTAATDACINTPTDYPAAVEVGNDDAGTNDEMNDPYATGGTITSEDHPWRPFDDAVGADGDTIERHLQFREFARLQFHDTWWTVSHFVPWRVHFRAARVGGQWQDNGSDAAADNAGF